MSSVDPTKPTTGTALTADVRANFQTIKTELEDFQSTATDDGTKGFHLVNYPPLSGEPTIVNYEYPVGRVIRIGAESGGSTDYSSEIQSLNDYFVTSGSKGTLVFEQGVTYKIDTKLTIDVAYVSIEGNGCKFDASGITSGEAILVTGTVNPTYYQANVSLRNFELAGDTAQSYGQSGTYGILFERGTENTGQGPAHINCYNLNIHHFAEGRRFEDSAYIINFYGCDVWRCTTLDSVPSGFADYGERISFFGGTLYQCVMGSNNLGATADLYYHSVSFDAMQKIARVENGAQTMMIGCHFESGDWITEDNWFYATGAGSLIQITDFRLLCRTGTAISTTAMGYSNSDVAQGGIVIKNGRWDVNSGQYTKRFFIEGDGRVVTEGLSSYNSSLVYKTFSRYQNRFLNGQFESSSDLNL